MSAGPFASKKALFGGLLLLCCALVVLTIVSTSTQRTTVLAPKKNPWFSSFGWYAGAKSDSEVGLVASHMKQFNANEEWYPLGSFKFDEGVPHLGGQAGR